MSIIRWFTVAVVLSLGCRLFAADKPWLVYMEASPAADVSRSTSALVSELYRQSLLLAAREEFGAMTRDAHCGEGMPTDASQYAGIIQIKAEIAGDGPSGPMVRYCFTGKGGNPLAGDIVLPSPNGFDVASGMIISAEAFSRDQAVKSLEAWGLPKRRAAGAVPTTMPVRSERPGEMCYVALHQYLRDAHAALLAQPIDSELTSGISRAYAQLAQLTRCHFDPTSRVLAARALLYAQRMVARKQNDPLALATRGYAQAFCGLHALALDDLAAARKNNGQFGFISSADLLCRYNRQGLLDMAAKAAGERELLTYMAFATIEHEPSNSLVIGSAEEAMQAYPHCFRYLDAAANVAGVSDMHELSDMGFTQMVRMLREELPRIDADLPEDVKVVREAARKNSDLVADVANVARAMVRSDVPAEPSWAMLGNFIEQTNFLHVYRRAKFMAMDWSVPTSGYLKQTKPLYQNHPLRDYILSFGDEYRQNRRQRMQFLSKLTVDQWFPLMLRIGLDLQGSNLAAAAANADDPQDSAIANAQRILQLCSFRSSRLAYDFEWEMQGAMNFDHPRNTAYLSHVAPDLFRGSPYNPTIAAACLASCPDLAKSHLDDWKKNLASSPVFLGALSKQYIKTKDMAAAAESLERCASLAPDARTFEKLADCYTALKQEDRALAALERGLNQEREGLAQAQIRLKLARIYRMRGDHARGLAQAELAADTWAGWAMIAAARYNELLGRWDRAELWHNRCVSRYDQAMYYYFYTVRTGHGDRRRALNLLERTLPRTLESGSDGDQFNIATVFICEGQWDKARPVLTSLANNRGTLAQLFLALQPGEAITKEQRIAWLNRCAREVEENEKVRGQLAAMIAKAMVANVSLDLNELEKLIDPADPIDAFSSRYCAAQYQMRVGRNAEALKLLQECTTAKAQLNDLCVTILAIQELRERKLFPMVRAQGVLSMPQTRPATGPAQDKDQT